METNSSGGEPPKESPNSGPDGTDREDLDVAIVLSLLRLTGGKVKELVDFDWPPDEISHWIRQTNLREVKGLLLATLKRWHELHGP